MALASRFWRGVLLQDPCVYCGGTPMGLDHILPLSKGGPNGWENRAPACQQCDLDKSDQPLLVFLRRHWLKPRQLKHQPKRLRLDARHRAIARAHSAPDKPILFAKHGRHLKLSPFVHHLRAAAPKPPPPQPLRFSLRTLFPPATS